MKVTYSYNEGHGWFAVSRRALVKLGVLHKVSPYSYQKGEEVFLEEDCDAALFFNAVRAKGQEPDVVEEFSDRIRNYRGFELRAHEHIESIFNQSLA